MSDKEKLKADVNPLMNTLVTNILRKHGVSKDSVRTLSEGEKENILKMLEDLKAQSEAVIQKQQEKQHQSEASSQSEDRPRRRRNRSNKNKLREKLRQRRQQETPADTEEKNGDLE
ncbi:spore coat protein [Bacillus swezeyi]|uniref:Spore coat protein n=1 Tax=Bacillus swezeyi TaxID=1925020 RepID=A0A1R1QBZ9_9BACI|nr:spore coat protein [Bacillus swezeyi]MEC1261500.1 spore coat protein [Bacillus swezeyi]MED1739178.1 spore coat protein [Bacillus swezeyi]MED2926637.1 spore coat protein [Bacillus swezeyi]MED2944108.1 spore coat protein [Bacillus swezeyi]MED2965801.1 spore coat protein [Bacillus swezeyi]